MVFAPFLTYFSTLNLYKSLRNLFEPLWKILQKHSVALIPLWLTDLEEPIFWQRTHAICHFKASKLSTLHTNSLIIMTNTFQKNFMNRICSSFQINVSQSILISHLNSPKKKQQLKICKWKTRKQWRKNSSSKFNYVYAQASKFSLRIIAQNEEN